MSCTSVHWSKPKPISHYKAKLLSDTVSSKIILKDVLIFFLLKFLHRFLAYLVVNILWYSDMKKSFSWAMNTHVTLGATVQNKRDMAERRGQSLWRNKHRSHIRFCADPEPFRDGRTAWIEKWIYIHSTTWRQQWSAEVTPIVGCLYSVKLTADWSWGEMWFNS